MPTPFSHFLSAAVLAAACAASVPAAAQDAWPSKPIRLVVPFGAGSPTDVIVRMVATRLSEDLKQPVVVENKPGAGGMIGYDTVAKAKPDGYTLGATQATFVTNRFAFKNVPYDELTDFVPVATFAHTPMMLVTGASKPVRNLAEFKALAAARPGTVTYASTSVANYLNAELARKQLNIDMRSVPYKEVSQALTDVMAGHVDAYLAPLSLAVPMIKGGKLKGLAVLSKERFTTLPDVPTANELGMTGVDIWTWSGIVAPAGTPEAIVERLHRATVRIVGEPAFKQRLATDSYEPFSLGRGAYVDLLKSELAAYARVAKEVGVKPE